MQGIPFGPESPIPEGLPPEIQEMLEHAQEQMTKDQMMTTDLKNRLQDLFIDQLSLAQLHLVHSLLEIIHDSPDPEDAAAWFSGLVSGVAVMREHHGEICENCHDVVTGLEEL